MKYILLEIHWKVTQIYAQASIILIKVLNISKFEWW
jgi:hypothetical protein